MPKEYILIPKDEVFDLLDEAEEVDTDHWKHGSVSRYVTERDGKHYAFWIEFHPSEGAQIYADVRADRVYPHTVSKTEWLTRPPKEDQ